MIVDQRDIELGFQRAVGAGRDGARADRQFGRERLDDAAVGEARADGAADAAMDLRPRQCRARGRTPPARRQNPGSAAAAAQRRGWSFPHRQAPSGTGPNSLKFVSGSGSATKTAPSMPKASTANGSATTVSSGRIWPPLARPSASVHSAWQWKNGAPSRCPKVIAPIFSRVTPAGRKVSL